LLEAMQAYGSPSGCGTQNMCKREELCARLRVGTIIIKTPVS